ncbi:MAG: ATP-binding protein [Chloracidobacterium sp.]|nr:ATP-binding protein [Chloracidobacterium sp.]
MDDETRKKWLLRALQMLIQDLAELIIKNDDSNPRIVKDLHNLACEKIAKKIIFNTGLSLDARTIRKFKNGTAMGSTQSREIVAAAWLVETGVIKKDEVKKEIGGKIYGYWDMYMDLFTGKKEDLSAFRGKQGAVTHEFQDKSATPKDLAMMICAFANKDGGCIIFGVGRDNISLDGIDCNSTLITNTLAALRRFDKNKPKIEFGWGYSRVEEKAFFVIRIYKSDSGITYSSDGRKYIKNGAGYKIIDKNERENEEYLYEQATNSRVPLIENLRRIKSILDDHLNYYEIKERPTSDEEMRIFFSISLRFIADTYITYLDSIWRAISFKDLPEAKIYLFESLKKEIAHSIRELRKGKVDLFLEDVRNRAEIHVIVSKQTVFLNRLILGPNDDITSAEVYQAIKDVNLAAERIDLGANNSFPLMQAEVRL